VIGFIYSYILLGFIIDFNGIESVLLSLSSTPSPHPPLGSLLPLPCGPLSIRGREPGGVGGG